MQYLWFYEARQILLSGVVWLAGYGPPFFSIFTTLATTQILITSPFLIVLYNELYHIKHEEWAFIWYIVWLHSVKLSCGAVSQCLTIDLSKSAAWNI